MTDKSFKEFCWNELSTMDVPGSKKFYGELLGWAHQDVQCGEHTYTIFKHNDKDIAGLMQACSECECSKKAMWLSYVYVENVDETVSKVEGLGGKVLCQPLDIPEIGRIAVIADPYGAAIGLFAKK